MEFFKGDELEKKFIDAGKTAFEQTSAALTEFNIGAYTTFALGDAIFDSKLSPLSNAIIKSIFRESFASLFDAFISAGNFESYLNVFRQIFGPDVIVVFTVPGNGQLTIDITATGFEISNFIARRISGNLIFSDQVITDLADNIIFSTVKGFETEYELEQMLFELVPAGIFTDINFTI